MNICYLLSNIQPSIGGTERVTISVAENLEQIGYSTYFVYTNEDNILIPEYKKMKIDYKSKTFSLKNKMLSFIIRNKIKVLIVVNMAFQTPKYQTIFSYLKKQSDVMIIASLHAAPDNWVDKDVWGAVLPKVYIKNILKIWIFGIWNYYAKRILGTYRVVDKYLLLSESYFDSFKKIYPTNDNGQKLIAIPNPFPFKDVYNQRKGKENIVLIVSRMQETQKRIYAAIKIWSKIEKKYPNWQLVIVGDGPDLNSYKKIAKSLLRITFVGHSNDVQDFYGRSKIFMMTSIWEGLPMTLIEAMHYGCIPIAFDNFASLHDLVDNGETGYIIQNNDIDSFTECLTNLMSDELLIKRISSNILNKHDLFKMDDIVKMWDIKIKEMCK